MKNKAKKQKKLTEIQGLWDVLTMQKPLKQQKLLKYCNMLKIDPKEIAFLLIKNKRLEGWYRKK